MNKTSKKIISMFLTLALCLPIFSNVAYASESKEVKNEVVLHKETYLSELTNESDFLNNKIKELEKNDFIIDPNVRSIKDLDFIYYHNKDESTTGLIQVNKNLNSEIRVHSINNNPETIEFIKENGSKMIVGKDNNGEFNKILYVSPNISTYKTDAASWCPYVVGLVGHSIGSLYAAIAGMVGGPLAAFIVGGVNTVGWTWVSEQCGK
ncbi:hypothetical protein ACKRLN_07390 [Anaerococcus sp. DFU013_CI05]|uniref:hypothetical protein n=2 Tax=Anaerococcus TaxID=165779 RepID=UPI0019315A30|nr:hypothetical protein [Anaerococcus sp. mt242]MBM0046256.1 hypothetical protein [Anaerococcus sp. mt242]